MNTSFDIPHLYEFKRHTDWPVDIGIVTGCILGYVIAWVGLVSYFCPHNWVAGVTGSLAGCFAGWLWFRLVRKGG
jgi:membrane associated rhomboid family serine protease